MPAVSAWVPYITIVGVILALIALTRTRVQNWATRRAVYHCLFWAHQHIPVRPASAVTRRKRLWLAWQQLRHKVVMRWVPVHHRVSLVRLVDAALTELKHATVAGEFSPNPATDSLQVEIAAYIAHKDRQWREKELMRRHKGVRCAGGCGTKYAKKRRDHDFAGWGGVRGSGGWRCEWIRSDMCAGSCIPTATGDHYCGMCEREARRASLAGPRITTVGRTATAQN